MKKYVVLISIVILICSILLFYDNEERIILTNGKSEQIINSNSLTMMYETEADSGEYQVSSDTTWPQDGYVFNETLSKCENGGILTWDDENKKVLLQTNTSDKCFIYFDKEPDIVYLADYIINNVYTGTDGENDIYYHDGVGTYTNADQEAGDNSYRYSGANPNNYICFGSDAVTCPSDNLYRIIGVFDNKVKLIKADYASTDLLGTESYVSDFSSSDYTNYKGNMDLIPRFRWDANPLSPQISEVKENNHTNVTPSNLKIGPKFLAVLLPERPCSTTYFAEGSLNLNVLNINFFNSFSEIWQTKIATVTWNSHSLYHLLSSVAKKVYSYEIGDEKSDNYVYDAKIGLLYGHDYLYGAAPDNWSNNSNEYNEAINNNWLYLGVPEFLITSIDEVGGMLQIGLHYISGSGQIDYGDSCNDGVTGFSYAAVRPSFYLNSDVTYVSGLGTRSNPYRIN